MHIPLRESTKNTHKKNYQKPALKAKHFFLFKYLAFDSTCPTTLGCRGKRRRIHCEVSHDIIRILQVVFCGGFTTTSYFHSQCVSASFLSCDDMMVTTTKKYVTTTTALCCNNINNNCHFQAPFYHQSRHLQGKEFYRQFSHLNSRQVENYVFNYHCLVFIDVLVFPKSFV